LASGRLNDSALAFARSIDILVRTVLLAFRVEVKNLFGMVSKA
jgi:hypothetical protein